MDNEILNAEVVGDSLQVIKKEKSLLQIANEAEEMFGAVIKIKKTALKATNIDDWTDQGGNPYLEGSGAEKIAGLFGISWILLNDPQPEFEEDGHFTYTYRGRFSLGGRTIEVDGSRSSKDPFFKKYDYSGPQKKEKPISAIEKRDVKMSAFTNLLVNGNTRILGIRNLTWDDLKEFAGITRDQVASVQYKKGGDKPPVDMPKEKGKEDEASHNPTVEVSIDKITQTAGKKKDGSDYTKYTIHAGEKKFSTFSKTIAETAKRSIEFKISANIESKDTQYGPEIVSLTLNEAPEPGSEG